MNSEQLMLRGFAVHGDEVTELGKGQPSSQSSHFKDAFEGYLMKEGPEKTSYKYNLNDLNEKRM